MAEIKVIYKNASGFDQEHSESSDSVKMLSFLTANHELTDTKLGALVTADGDIGNTYHQHDGIYFRESEHLSSSAGVGDAGKPIVLDADGHVDASMINDADIDHGSIGGLGDDDHAQYLLTSGARDITGVQKYASLVSIADEKALTHKKYVDDSIASAIIGQEWLYSAISVLLNPVALTPVTGDRYLINGIGAGAWVGQDNKVAEWNGSAWTYQTPSTGTFISVDNEPTLLYYFGGSAWDSKYFESSTASTGLVKVGMDIRLDSSSAGDGLGFSAGVLSVNTDDSSLEVNADTLRVKALGIKDSMIDFGVSTGQVSAADLPIADSNSVITATEVEGALQELAQADIGIVFVAAEALTRGDLVYVSANNTVSKLSTLSSNADCIGVVSNSGAILGGNVRIKRVARVLSGVLSGATAGVSYYWNGSALVSTAPSGSGSNVWKIGVSKNTTDLMLNVEHVKKNA